MHVAYLIHISFQPKIETSHPKIEKLIQVVLEHFQNYKERNLDTRVMIFSQYRLAGIF